MCSSPVDSSNYQGQRSSTHFGAGKYAKFRPDSNAEDMESVPRPDIAYSPIGKQQQSTCTRTFANLHDALDRSLFWKPSKSSTKSSLHEFLSNKEGDGNESKGWLRRDLGLSSTGYLTDKETKILTVMSLSLSGTTPLAASALAFAWGLDKKTVRSASKKSLLILMTNEPSVVEIGCQEPSVAEIECQTEQTTLERSFVDGGCQTEVSLLLTGSEHAQMLASDIIIPLERHVLPSV
jgi:hypothetical protein